MINHVFSPTILYNLLLSALGLLPDSLITLTPLAYNLGHQFNREEVYLRGLSLCFSVLIIFIQDNSF